MKIVLNKYGAIKVYDVLVSKYRRVTKNADSIYAKTFVAETNEIIIMWLGRTFSTHNTTVKSILIYP